MSSGSSEDIGEGIMVKPQEICMPYLFKDCGFFPPGIVWHILQVPHSLHRHHGSKLMLEAYYLLT